MRLSTRYIVTVKRVLTAKIPCLSICNCLSFLTAPIPVILPTPQSAIKTVLTSPWTGRNQTTRWLKTSKTLPPPFSRNILCWMFWWTTAFLTVVRRYWWCDRTRLPPPSAFCGKLRVPLQRRTGQNRKAVGISGTLPVLVKPSPALKPRVWQQSWTLLIKSSLWSTGKTSITRPWRNISVFRQTASTARKIPQALNEIWIRTITKLSSLLFRNSITWWKQKATCLYIISKWCLYLMNATAASLEKRRKTWRRNSNAIISLVLPAPLFSGKTP